MSGAFVETAAILAPRVATDEAHPAAKTGVNNKLPFDVDLLGKLNQTANLCLKQSDELSGWRSARDPA
ncbi:MAG: hypothetical protein RKO66_00900 [Candidatus Contendobacter sp.]|nr:hypothetical protein [Candidatus Contendobacter sp.]MDS4060412.1 hypothetical protein [Candidatus Contendobacter sp.]